MFERVEISCDSVTDQNLMACEIPRIKYQLHGKNYTVRVGWSFTYWTSPPNSNPYHIIYAISQVMSKLDLFSFYIHKNEKATSIRKCLPVSFSQLCWPNAIVGFFLDLFVYLLRCLMISLYWDVSCVWAQYIYLESGKSTMPIEPCHVFARWGVTLISCGYLPVKPEKDFIILSAFSMCNAFTSHCSYIHCFVGVFGSFWKSRLNEGFLEWTVFWNEQTFVS